MKLFESRIGPSVFKSYYKHAQKVFETDENMNVSVRDIYQQRCTPIQYSSVIKSQWTVRSIYKSMAMLKVILLQ